MARRLPSRAVSARRVASLAVGGTIGWTLASGRVGSSDKGLLGGLRREWAEELIAGFVPDFRLVALLNDDTTPVGAVHLGAVYLADAGGRDVAIRETDKLAGSFASPAEVGAVADRLETWSQLAFGFLEATEGAEVR